VVLNWCFFGSLSDIMGIKKEVEEKIREYFKKKYGVYPTDSQLKETIGSLKSLGKAVFHFLSIPSKKMI